MGATDMTESKSSHPGAPPQRPPPIGPAEFQHRRERLSELLAQSGLAAALVTTEANFRYLTGLAFDPLWSSATRTIAALVGCNGSLSLILPGFLVLEASEHLPNATIYPYASPPEDPLVPLRQALRSAGTGPVGAELSGEARLGMAATAWQELIAHSRAEFADVQALLLGMRLRKSPAEIGWLRAASHANVASFAALFAQERLGISEREAANILFQAGLAGGADRTGWVAVTSGAGNYHRFTSAPRDRRLESGDMLWADLGLVANGYWSDYCRAGIVGGPSVQQMDLQRRILDCTQSALDRVAPGVPVAEVAKSCRNRAIALGLDMLKFGRLGHGIGLSATEPPSIAEWDNTILQPGMVITVEPAIVEKTGLYCAEQIVAIGENGSEVLSTAPSSLASI
jgi:Xaa-Pro aminopeptidase